MTTTTAPAPTGRKTTTGEIEVARIDRRADQPRTYFDPAGLTELAQSMRAVGQIQAISVRYIPQTRRYELISGERRWRAAQEAGIATLRAVIEHGLAEADVLPRAVAENTGRRDMTPLEEADAFDRLTKAPHNKTIAEIARLAGKTEDYVTYRIELLGLTDSCRRALDAGHLLPGVAWYVCRLSPTGASRSPPPAAR
jgi:ParB family chromosome partitioning protein